MGVTEVKVGKEIGAIGRMRSSTVRVNVVVGEAETVGGPTAVEAAGAVQETGVVEVVKFEGKG